MTVLLFLAPLSPQGVCKNIKPLYQCISYYSGWVILIIILLSVVSGLLAIVGLLQVSTRFWTYTKEGWRLERLRRSPAHGEVGLAGLCDFFFAPEGDNSPLEVLEFRIQDHQV